MFVLNKCNIKKVEGLKGFNTVTFGIMYDNCEGIAPIHVAKRGNLQNDLCLVLRTKNGVCIIKS